MRRSISMVNRRKIYAMAKFCRTNKLTYRIPEWAKPRHAQFDPSNLPSFFSFYICIFIIHYTLIQQECIRQYKKKFYVRFFLVYIIAPKRDVNCIQNEVKRESVLPIQTNAEVFMRHRYYICSFFFLSVHLMDEFLTNSTLALNRKERKAKPKLDQHQISAHSNYLLTPQL